MFHRASVAWTLAAASSWNSVGCTGETSEVREPFRQDEPGFYQELSWSPDGRTLLVSVLEFTDAAPGYAYRIWKLDLDGGATAPLTDGPRDYWTSWSPDGARIAFAAAVDDGSLDVFVMNADGSGRRRLTRDTADDTQPDWSPDGRRIAFITNREGTAQLWVMNADGTDLRRLVRSAREAQYPTWSPDGKRIVYYETDGQGNDEIFIAHADGSAPQRLAKGLWPTWTPDGQGVLYSADDGLYRLSLTGDARERIIGGAVDVAELSADGTRLAYIVQDSMAVTVLVAFADGRDPSALMTRPAPNW